MSDELYYKELREQTYRAVEKLHKQQAIRLSSIDTKAVSASIKHGYTWAWDDDDNARIASRFEVAAWKGSDLTGLCRGKPIEAHSKLCLEIVEAAPDISMTERGAILPIMSACASIYGRLIGAQEIRVLEPTSASRVRLYERYGYRYVASGNYLFKKV